MAYFIIVYQIYKIKCKEASANIICLLLIVIWIFILGNSKDFTLGWDYGPGLNNTMTTPKKS
jgi:hypothetical protein